MSIKLNPEDLQVTSFAAAPAPESPDAMLSGTTRCQTEQAFCTAYFTCGCGTYDGVCTSPGYNC